MLGGIVHGIQPNILKDVPPGAVSIDFSTLVDKTGLRNVVSGHYPEIRLFPGVGDALVCRAGQRWHCLGVPDPEGAPRTREEAIFLLERLAFGFFDWGAKEVLRTARLRGDTGHEFLSPADWDISPAERDWLWWGEQDVVGNRVVFRPTAPDRRDRVRAGPRPTEWQLHH